MKMSDLLGALVQSGMKASSTGRVQSALGGAAPRGPTGLGGLLGEVLSQATRVAGGQQNLAMGGLGALAGALLGGGSRSVGGAMGGGVMALLGAMAFKALQAKGAARQVPLGLRAPETAADEEELEQRAELVLRAMINAAKADGKIDEAEIGRIVGKLQEEGADGENQRFVMTEMQRPLQTEDLIAAARGNPEIAVEIYGASLMAIDVDTTAEKAYLDGLARGLGLTRDLTDQIEGMVGLSRR